MRRSVSTGATHMAGQSMTKAASAVIPQMAVPANKLLPTAPGSPIFLERMNSAPMRMRAVGISQMAGVLEKRARPVTKPENRA